MGWKLTAPKPSESEIELQVGHYLSYKKIFFTKLVSTGYYNPVQKQFRRQANPYALRGLSDYLLIIKGRAYFWELKSDIGIQSPSQKIFEARLIKEGQAPYTIIRSLADAERALAEILLQNK